MINNKLTKSDILYYTLLNIATFSTISVVIVFLTILLKKNGFSAQEIGFALSLSYISTFLSPLLFLKLSFNISSIRFFLGVFALNMALIPILSDQFVLLCINLFVLGISRNVFQTYLESSTHIVFKEKYSVIRSFGSLGFLFTTYYIGTFFSFELLDYYTYVLAFILFIYFLLFKIKNKNTKMEPETFNFKLLFDNKLLWVFILVFHISVGILFSFLSIYLIDNSFNMSEISNLWNIGIIAEIVVFLLFSLFKNKLSEVSFISISIIMTIIRFVLLYLFPDNFALLLIAQVLHLFTFGIFHINFLSLFHKIFPNNFKMSIKLYFAIGYGLSFSIGSLMGGYLYSSNIFLYAAIISFISFIIWLFLIKQIKIKEAYNLRNI